MGSAGSLESARPAVPIENDESWDSSGEDETGEEECPETDPIVEPKDPNLHVHNNMYHDVMLAVLLQD